jgi:NADPH:quinone reductase-like Zn-dependent oxidoreductase
VGIIAIQLAKHLGATVATTTSTENVDWVKRLGADTVIDYKRDDFETVVHDYDLVLDSLGGETLEKSLRVLKPGGKVIGIGGPPDPDFAREIGSPWIIREVMRVLSYRTRKRAKRLHVSYSFLFMRATANSCARSVLSSMLGPSAQSWIVSFPSKRPKKLWPTWNKDAQKARWSSR